MLLHSRLSPTFPHRRLGALQQVSPVLSSKCTACFKLLINRGWIEGYQQLSPSATLTGIQVYMQAPSTLYLLSISLWPCPALGLACCLKCAGT